MFFADRDLGADAGGGEEAARWPSRAQTSRRRRLAGRSRTLPYRVQMSRPPWVGTAEEGADDLADTAQLHQSRQAGTADAGVVAGDSQVLGALMISPSISVLGWPMSRATGREPLTRSTPVMASAMVGRTRRSFEAFPESARRSDVALANPHAKLRSACLAGVPTAGHHRSRVWARGRVYGNRPEHEPAGLRRRSMGISNFAWLKSFRSRPSAGVGGGLVSADFCQADRSSGIGRGSYPGLSRRSWRTTCPGAFAATWVLRRSVIASRTGSRRAAPGWCGRVRWRAWLPPSPKRFDDEHAATQQGQAGSQFRAWRRDRRQAVRGPARYWPCGRNSRTGRSGGCGGNQAAGHGAGSGG